MAMVLLVDDQPENSAALALLLANEGHSVHKSSGLNDALSALETSHFDVVVTDVRMDHELDGMRLLRQVKATTPDVEVVLCTGFGTIEHAVEAIRIGAYDYLTMPIHPDRLLDAVQGAADRRRAMKDVWQWRWPAQTATLPGGVIAVDPTTKAVFAKACQIAAADIPVLIMGESGTGKELVARAVHRCSRRAPGQFVPLNCSAIAETLVESELFGHKKGAFTGAVSDKRGLAEEADGGVLFLDEIGDMPPYVQVRLLRFLDSGELRRVGDTTLRHTSVRLIAATNRNLRHDVDTGRFRHDLFYRLGVISLLVPPLRERQDDIEPLAAYYLQQVSARLNRPCRGFTEDAMVRLHEYSWPGNVRELKAVIEGAIVMTYDDVITSADLPASVRFGNGNAAGDPDYDPADAQEIHRLTSVLEQYNGNHRQAANALGVSRTTLWRRLRRLKVSV